MSDKEERIMRKYVVMVRRTGDPTVAYTAETEVLPERRVEKEDQIYFFNPNLHTYQMVRPIDYGDHFIYADPWYPTDHGKGRWFAMCTCGSPAVLVNPDVLEKAYGMHETHARLVCYIHLLTSHELGQDKAHHATGGKRWV